MCLLLFMSVWHAHAIAHLWSSRDSLVEIVRFFLYMDNRGHTQSSDLGPSPNELPSGFFWKTNKHLLCSISLRIMNRIFSNHDVWTTVSLLCSPFKQALSLRHSQAMNAPPGLWRTIFHFEDEIDQASVWIFIPWSKSSTRWELHFLMFL